jgi:pyridinium-3,5-biscarboxylic acid mononucleotide sulfurtransferase
MDAHAKLLKLQQILTSYDKAAVAFSGGVDSTFLLAAACKTLGPQNVLACIGTSASLSAYQLDLARKMAAFTGAELVELPLDELSDPHYQANNADRCFHCKTHQFRTIRDYAAKRGFSLTLCGSNFDDKDDFRPGNRAVAQLGIAAPLMEAELTKPEIRFLSAEMGLPTADMPASPCLASRIAYGETITDTKLSQVERAEDSLRGMGFVQFRVRHHGTLARVEVPAGEIERALAQRERIVNKLKAVGFKFVTLDLEGFRSGAMNEVLTDDQKQGF